MYMYIHVHVHVCVLCTSTALTMYYLTHNTCDLFLLPPFLSCCPDSGLCPRRSERDSGGLRRRQQQSRQHHRCLGLCAGDCESGVRGGEGFSVGTAQEAMIYMYMCMCTYTCTCVRMLHVTVCLWTLPYLLSLVLICIYMYEIDHVLYIHTYMYTIRTCTLHVHYMYSVHVISSSSSHSPSLLPPSLPPSLPLSLPQLECCGVNSSSNWEVNPNVMTYPDSCCPGSFNTSLDPPCPEPFADVRRVFSLVVFFFGGGGGIVYVHVHKMKSLCSPLSLPPSLPQGCEQALTDFIKQNLLIVAAVGITFVVAEVSHSLRPATDIWSYFMQ